MTTISLAGVYLMALLGRTVVGQEPGVAITLEKPVKDEAAYEVGHREAEEELKAGRATIYVYGLPSAHENLDRKTGLPRQAIAGCVMDDAILGRAAGHNDRIAEYIREHGPPSNSFKRWEKELFDLKGYYESRLKAERPHRLASGGPVVRSPDGRVTIHPVKIQYRKDGSLAEILGLVVGGDGVEHEASWVPGDEGGTDLLWGPKGSGFAVVRCEGKDKPRYMALDLRRGRWLREER
jgi:hypothetical protein